MKVLVTGSDGMLGSSLLPLIKNKFNIVTTVHKKSSKKNICLDIGNFKKVETVIVKNNIDCIVHLAAITDVDYCEKHKNIAMYINYLATKNIVRICKKYNIYLIFLSSGAVFSGKKKIPYKENDRRKPVNVYGYSKKLAENCVKQLKQFCIIRTGWSIGGGKKDHKFVSLIIKQLYEGKKNIYAISDRYGSPTLTDDLSLIIYKIMLKRIYGVFHIVNKGIASRFDICKLIFQTLKIKNIQLKPVSFKYFNETAQRPTMEALNCNRIYKRFNWQLPDWKVSLRKYLLKYEK